MESRTRRRRAVRALGGLAVAAIVACLAGCDAILATSDLAQVVGPDERTRKKFEEDLEAANVERAKQGLLPLDNCSQCYWKNRGWALGIEGCEARVRRWEFGDDTALDPPGAALERTVPAVSESVQAVYDKRARDDRFLRSDDAADSRDYHSRRKFRQDLQRASAERIKQGLSPLDLCSQSYWKNRRWAMKVDDCEERVRRWESGDSSALDPMVLALGANSLGPDSVRSDVEPATEVNAWKSFRFHPGPKSQCGTFAVTEFSILYRLGSEEEVPGAERYYASLDAGIEHNLFDHLAVGGSIFGGLDDSNRAQVGARARLRYWLSKSASIDVAPGLVLGGKEEDDADFLPPAPILRVSLNPSASVGFVYQMFETEREKSGRVERERASYVGGQLSSTAGVAGTGVALVIAAVVAALIVSSLGN